MLLGVEEYTPRCHTLQALVTFYGLSPVGASAVRSGSARATSTTTVSPPSHHQPGAGQPLGPKRREPEYATLAEGSGSFIAT